MSHTLTWEKGRQLKNFDTNTYTYNANGIRISKTVNGIKHTYILDGTKILKESYGDNTIYPLYNNEDEVCGIQFNGEYYFFLKNLQNDVIAITDDSGKTLATYTYDAWGKCTVTSDISTIGIAEVNPYRYRSYYYDSEIEMYYLQSRYYDPNVGRFINADDVAFLGANGAPLSYNLFVYCDNNIISHSDPTGKYTGTLVISNYFISLLSGSLPGIMTGISTSMASIKVAITTSWFIPACVAATAIAIAGIVYVVNRVGYLSYYATQTISSVKSKVRAGGLNTNILGDYTVYVIARNGTIDVVYVGITKRYLARKSAHKKRFSTSKYKMLPIATGLTKSKARALEQTIISAYGLDTLKNMINSISPKKWANFKIEFDQMKTLIESWKDPE